MLGGCVMDDRDVAGLVVWISERDRIASFHPVDGYRRQIFRQYDFFMSFLHSLQERGFRFQ